MGTRETTKSGEGQKYNVFHGYTPSQEDNSYFLFTPAYTLVDTAVYPHVYLYGDRRIHRQRPGHLLIDREIVRDRRRRRNLLGQGKRNGAQTEQACASTSGISPMLDGEWNSGKLREAFRHDSSTSFNPCFLKKSEKAQSSIPVRTSLCSGDIVVQEIGRKHKAIRLGVYPSTCMRHRLDSCSIH